MYVDYLTVMLINLVAGLVLLAHFVWFGLDSPNQKQWVPGLGISGFLSLITGLGITFVWPLPGAYNIGFGEMSVLFGAVFLGAALAIAFGWSLETVAYYAFFAGIAAVIVGARVVNLNLTKNPALSGSGFILVGMSGIGAALAFHLKSNSTLRLVAVLVILAGAAAWAVVGYPAYWDHWESFSKWVPATMK